MRPHLWQTLKGQRIPGPVGRTASASTRHFGPTATPSLRRDGMSASLDETRRHTLLVPVAHRNQHSTSTHATWWASATTGRISAKKGHTQAIDATSRLRAHSQSDETVQGSADTHWNPLLGVSNRHHQQRVSPYASSRRQSVNRCCLNGIWWPNSLVPSNRGSHETAGVHQHLKTGVPNRQPRQTMPTDVSKRRTDTADHWTREDRRCQETVPVGHRNRLCAMKYQRLETGVVGHHPRQTISANANRWHPCISKTLPVDWRHHSQAVPSIRGNRYRNEQPFGTASDGVRRSW